jgi:hypothetical protein
MGLYNIGPLKSTSSAVLNLRGKGGLKKILRGTAENDEVYIKTKAR